MSSVSSRDPRLQPPSSQQIAQIEAAVRELSPSALLWASGYLAGLAAAGAPVAPDRVATPAPTQRLTILVGSQTGTGKRLAEKALAACQQRGFAARLLSLADFNARQIKQETALLLIVSTHGDGDPPDEAVALHRYLNGTQASRLEKLDYAVLALGDSSYPHFCKTGRDFDERLGALGARPVLSRVECDVDLSAASADWFKNLANAFAAILPATTGSAPVLAAAEASTGTARVHATAKVLANQRITGRGSSKVVRHLEFELDTQHFDYVPGDSVSLKARNPEPVVQEILQLMQWDAAAEVRLGGRSLTLGEALRGEIEITQLSRPVLNAVIARGGNARLREWLADNDTATISAWMLERQLVDVLRESRARLAPQALVELARPLAVRAYSIASSRRATPDELHLTVAVVDDTRDGHLRPGCASSYLAALQPGANLELLLDRNPAFRLPPSDETPLIMVGPGTGIAPFRAFIEERAARGAKGKHWLFFGERTQREDFLYQVEWQRHLRQGALSRLDGAFSRDGTEKIYVQDRLVAAGAEVFAWLQQGACFYVCGDAQRMAKDVHRALINLVVAHGGLDIEAAEEYLFTLRQQGRYQRDVY